MKRVTAGTTLLASSFSLLGAFGPRLDAREYFIDRDARGGLVISNQKPPPGSTIIRQRMLPDEADNDSPPAQQSDKASTDGDSRTSPKPDSIR